MSPDAWRPAPPDPYGHLRPVPCEQARRLLRGGRVGGLRRDKCARGNGRRGRITTNGGLPLVVLCLHLRDGLLRQPLALRDGRLTLALCPFRELGQPEPVAPPVFPRLPRENFPPPRRKPKPGAEAE